jgi:hypothetical protein
MKRRRNKQNKNSYANEDIHDDPHAFSEYNTYGSPTVVGSDHNSVIGSRPMSAVGAKPRPFVQAYNPEPGYEQQYDNQQHYPEYQQTQQPYGQSNNYPYDAYYGQQVEPMIPTSGRNVPDEVDYPRHVPDEIDPTPPARK